MRIILGILGILFGAVLIKFREQVGDMFGQPSWADKVGGIYNVIVIIGILIFFWSISYMTNTQDIFFAPLFYFLPGRNAGSAGVPGTEF